MISSLELLPTTGDWSEFVFSFDLILIKFCGVFQMKMPPAALAVTMCFWSGLKRAEVITAQWPTPM